MINYSTSIVKFTMKLVRMIEYTLVSLKKLETSKHVIQLINIKTRCIQKCINLVGND